MNRFVVGVSCTWRKLRRNKFTRQNSRFVLQSSVTFFCTTRISHKCPLEGMASRWNRIRRTGIFSRTGTVASALLAAEKLVQLINQSINQSINPSINPITNHAFNQSINRMLTNQIIKSINQSSEGSCGLMRTFITEKRILNLVDFQAHFCT